MGYTEVKTHIKINSKDDIERVSSYLSGFPFDEKYIEQNGYLTLNTEMVSFENFEEIANGISAELNLNVLISLVYDSDVAVIQGYVNGEKKYEEVKSFGENAEMDRQRFLQDFFLVFSVSDFNEVLDKDDCTYAEDRLFELSDIVGIKLLDE